MWHPDAYLQRLYETKTQAFSFAKLEKTIGWNDWRVTLRARFIEALGGFEDTRGDLQPRELERTDCGDYIRERVEITTVDSLRMPMYMLLPKERKGKLPVVIGCHGHGCGSKAAVGLLPDGSAGADEAEVHHQFAVSLVRRGFAVIVPELIGFGDRRLEQEPVESPSANSCFPIGVYLLMLGRTIAGLRIQETMAAIGYVPERSELDASRIGIFGLSGGGLVAAFTAALDERIGAAVVSGYTNTFRDSILNRRHCIDNYVPGLLRDAEMADWIGLIAPRPLFIEAGRNDELFPLHGTEEAVANLRRIYAAAGAGERLGFQVFEGGHEISGEASYPWLERQLRP